jgi:hypothetical protein
MIVIMKFLWRRWKKLVHKINDVIAFFLMGFTYVFAVAPVAIYFKITGQNLLDRSLGEESLKSYWLPKKEIDQDIRRVQRQY